MGTMKMRWINPGRGTRRRNSELGSITGWIWLLGVGFLFFSAGNSHAAWESAGRLRVPAYSYNYLAASPTGDLLAVTYNINPVGQAPQSLPALLIRNPLSPQPEVIELCRSTFDAQRGYGGLACDDMGYFSVSGDTGNRTTCFVRKFRPNGTPETTFAQGGELRPNRRCLGIDVLGNFLLLAVDWGEVQVYHSATGSYIGSLPSAPGTTYVRDIAIDPGSMRVYGVAAGSVVVWEGGAPWDPGKYRFRLVTEQAGRVRSGEAISFDPLTHSALTIPIPGNTLLEVRPDGALNRSVIATANPNGQLSDACMTFDGTTLFISDMESFLIHIMQRSMGQDSPGGRNTTNARPTSAAPPTPVTRSLSNVPWHRSYTEVVEQARRQGKPMIVYFRKGDFKRCDDFENNCLLTDAFNQRGGRFVCVFEDLATHRLLAYRFGVFRVPHVVVLDHNGETIARYTFDIDPNALYGAMDSVR
jgi:hypothetical protein